ncbi:FAD-dependent monooxygenase [Dactylosporangium roseum]|uniref:FAD-dependent monooxygenase n=1 Tax=Dactylosporangium roseum TaxID=47989 RepID=A0ABY5YYY6_9ACTN|nr:NAD(P)/FAD-dependent oxidoreductase [Dactylosporangium roseum]UWZ34591.1 FAD-dependent monooxygenase [Dactylosporangium roseum]
MHGSLEVTIAGGGIAGLAAALAFRRSGCEVTIGERAAQFGPVGAGVLLQANGLLVLDSLGLGDEVRSRGAVMPRFALRDRSGKTLLETGLDAHLPPRLWPVCIHRADLHEVLWQACLRARVKVHFQHTVAAVEDIDRRPVLVCESPQGTTRIAGDLIVGADGVKSAVRDAAGISPERWPVLEGSVQGVAPVSLPADVHGEYLAGPEACGMLPVRAGSTFWFWGGSSKAVNQVGESDFASWKTDVCNRFPPMRLVLDGYDSWQGTVRLQHSSVHCETWSSGRVVLIGDAAHAMSPNLGQGANCALVDAVALAACVAEQETKAGLPEALNQFELGRRPIVDSLQRKGHDEGASVMPRWTGYQSLVNLAVRLARFTPSSMKRAAVLSLSGLDGREFDLHSAGVRAPIPW